jgi:hypothetical protein
MSEEGRPLPRTGSATRGDRPVHVGGVAGPPDRLKRLADAEVVLPCTCRLKRRAPVVPTSGAFLVGFAAMIKGRLDRGIADQPASQVKSSVEVFLVVLPLAVPLLWYEMYWVRRKIRSCKRR